MLPCNVQHETDAGEISFELANGADQCRREAIDLFQSVEIIVHTVTNFQRIIREVIILRRRVIYRFDQLFVVGLCRRDGMIFISAFGRLPSVPAGTAAAARHS